MRKVFQKMETRRLHNPDIKQLVQILRIDPHSAADPGDVCFKKATQAAIKKLPRRLRSSPLSYHGTLCRTHKGLDVYLINDVWSWIKFELEVAIGRFLYPIVISKVLSERDEHRVRQLEPVLRMFNTDWTLAASAAPGKTPIDAGTKWTHQENRCPACMLTRIGSDMVVLFALFAGMYGHLRSRSGGRKGVNQIRSKRLRFVRYWMKTHLDGDQAAAEAYDLGVDLKAIRRDAKASLRLSTRPTRSVRNSLDEVSATPRHCLEDQFAAAFDISEPHNPDDRTANATRDFKIGPIPPLGPKSHTFIDSWNPANLIDTTYANLEQSKIEIQPPTPHSATSIFPIPFTYTPNSRRDSGVSKTSIIRPRPASSIYSVPHPSVATLRAPRPASYAYTAPPNDSRHSIASSLMSYNDPTKRSTRRGYDPLETVDEWMDKCMTPLETLNLRDYVPPINNTDDQRANEYMAKYRPIMAPQAFGFKGNRREAVLLEDEVPLEGDARHNAVRYMGQVLPKPSRCSIYSAFGEEGRDGEEFEQVDETPPPSPINEKFKGEVVDDCAEGYGKERGVCTPASLQSRRYA